MPTSTCPDDTTLANVLCGLAPAELAEMHEPHLAHCKECAEKAAQLCLTDDLVEALRGTEAVEETASIADGPILADLIDRLSGFAERPDFTPLLTDDELRSVLGPATSEDELGRLGHYRVLEVLGAGGMGIVFKAEDTQLGRTVAIKVMRPQLAASRDACRRFQREACAAAAFEHNNVITIYHVGEERGTPYFSMQLLEGESLRQRLARVNQLSVREVLRIGREIGMGLAAAHRRGLLHRDIKPDNVWLESDSDQVKIVDFGLARDVDQSSSVTNSGAILGTPKYMAPEQVRCEGIDERCDLFSLGSLLFHMATGDAPFSGNNLVATLVAVSQDEVTPPQQLNPELPRELSNLIVQLLAKEPGNRIQTADEVVQRITKIESELDGKTVTAVRPPRRSFRNWFVAAAFGFAIAMATIIYVVTDKGTLMVEADDSVAVSVEKGTVMIRDRASGREWVARIGRNPVKSGAYEIFTKEKGSDLEFSTRELSIMRGEERRVHISLKTGPGLDSIKAAPSDPVATSIPKIRKTPAWLSETEDTLGIKPGDPLSSLVLVSEPTKLDKVISWTVESVEHRSYVEDAVFSPDGALIATAGRDGTTRIWDASDRQLQSIIVCPGPVETVAWTSDGRFLATAQSGVGTGSICIWGLSKEGARLVKKINRRSRNLGWSPNGRFLAFRDNGVHLWDFETGEILPSFGVEGIMSHRPWSANGAFLATTTEEGIAIWDVVQQKLVKTLSSEGAREAIWSREGAYIACLRRSIPPVPPEERGRSRQVPGYVEIWDVAKSQRIRNFAIGTGYSGELSWSPDESTVVTRFGDVVSLWDVSTGMHKNELLRHETEYGKGGSELDWSPNATQIALLIDGTVRLWDLDGSKAEMLTGQQESVRLEPASFVSQVDLLATSHGYDFQNSRLWDIRKLTPLVEFEEAGWNMVPSHDGKQLAAVHSNSHGNRSSPVDLEIRFYNLPVAKQQGSVKVRLSRSPLVLWSPDSSRLLVYARDLPHGFIFDGPKVVHELGRFYEAGTSLLRASRGSANVAWSPNSRYLTWSDQNGEIDIIDVGTGEVDSTLAVGERPNRNAVCRGLAWSRSGNQVAAMFEDRDVQAKIHVWDIKPGSKRMLPTTSLAGADSYDVLFSPDGRRIASAQGANVVSVWDLAATDKVVTYRCPCEQVEHAAWLQDSQHISIRGADGIGVVDIKTGKVEYRTEDADGDYVSSTQSGNTLAVGWSNHVSFYDLSLTSQTTLVLPAAGKTGALSVNPNGAFRLGEESEKPRIVVLSDGVQRTFTPGEFAKRFDWQNKPSTAEFGSSGTAYETQDNLAIEPGQPLSDLALVQQPAILPEVQSWTLEPVDQRSETINVEFSPDGSRIATSGLNGVVRIWDTDTRELQGMIVCPGSIWSIAWSPDGTALATAQFHESESSDGSVCLWDVQSGVKLIRKINRSAWRVNWTPDGKILAGWQDKQIWFWNEGSKAFAPTILTNGQPSTRPFSPDGASLALSTDHGIELWDIARAKLTKTLPTDRCTGATWLEDGASIACLRIGLFSEDGENVYLHKVEVWDVAKSERTEEITVARLPKADSVDFAFSSDETTILTNLRGKIELWDRASGKRRGDPLVESAQPDVRGYATLARWSSDGEQLAYLDRGVVQLWDLATKTAERLTGYSTGISITGASLRQEGNLMVTKTHDGLRHTVWDLDAAKALLHLTESEWQTEFSPDGKLLAALRRTDDGSETPMKLELRVYRLSDAELRHSIKLSVPLTPQLVWAPDSERIALTSPTSQFVALNAPAEGRRGVELIQASFITVVDAVEGKTLLERGAILDTRYQPRPSIGVRNSGDARRVAWSPDSSFLASWDKDSTVIVTEVATGKVVHTLNAPHRGSGGSPSRTGPAKSVFGIAWSPSGNRLAYLDGDNFSTRRLVVWSMSQSVPELLTTQNLTEARRSRRSEHVVFSPDSKRIMDGIGTTKLNVWDATTGQNIATLDGPSTIRWAAWRSDSQQISLLGPNGIELWNPTTGHQRQLRGFGAEDSYTIALPNDMIATAAGPRFTFWDAQLRPTSSWLVDLVSPASILGVTPQGYFIQSDKAQPPRFLVLSNREQKMLTYAEFSKQYGWQNTKKSPIVGQPRE